MKKTSLSTRTFAASLLLLTAVFAAPPLVQAVTYNQQIQNLKAQNQAASSAVADLAGQAQSYEQAISQLNAQISGIEAEIAQNKAQQARLQQQIIDAQNKIALERSFLAESLKTMYQDGQMSTIEELATSKSLSEYVDKQEYRNIVQKKLQTTMATIKKLEAQLTLEKQQVEELLKMQKEQEAQLSASRAKQQELLAYNQAQQAEYTAQISKNKTKISELQAAQAAIDRALAQNSRAFVNQGYVKAGQQIARMGSTGFSTGVHTHFAARTAGGVYFDPLAAGYGWPAPQSGQWQISQPFGCTTQYGEPYDPNCATGRTHQGVDIWGSAGSPIVAAASGDIIFNNCSTYLPGYGRPGLGWLVMIRHANGDITMYAHNTTPGGQTYGNC